jgi:hypothetical protein
MNGDNEATPACVLASRKFAGRDIEQALSEVSRELSVRNRCFPRWVQEKKLDAVEARDRQERMEAAAAFLQSLLDTVPAVQ